MEIPTLLNFLETRVKVKKIFKKIQHNKHPVL